MKLAYVAMLLAVLNVASVRAADELDAIEVKMKSLWDGFKSMTYDSEMKADSSTDQFMYKMDSTGTIEMMKSGEKNWKMRSEGKMQTVQKLPGQPEQKTETYSQVVSDGETMYSYTESQGQKSATKMKVPPQQETAGDSFFKAMRPLYDMKVLPDETVDGMACWVVEARSKQKEHAGGPMKYYISKDYGTMVVMQVSDAAGKVTSVTKMKNIKVNPSIAADRFVFTPPAGVTVTDADALNAQALQAQAAAQAAAADAEKKAAEAQKKEEPAKTEAAPAKSEEPAKTEPAKKEEKPDTKKKIKKGFGF